MSSPFGTDAMAAGYARARPPVHARVLATAREHLTLPIARALDVGCGAGLSTRALEGLAAHCIGMEPAGAMLQWTGIVAPEADFLVGAAEAIPLPRAAVDLLTAAGSLNYVHLDRFFPEAHRVLAPHGTLLVYDFAPGRRFGDGPGLEGWFAAFERRHVPPRHDARHLDPAILGGLESGFDVRSHGRLDVALPLSLPAYVDYVMTETRVAAAVRGGTPGTAIRAWCEDTLAPLWTRTHRTIVFESYFVCMTRRQLA